MPGPKPILDRWITQMRKGLLELCVLNLLRHGERHGYGMVQALRNIEVLTVSESTLYPILSRLREERVLAVRDVPSPAGPPRRCFSLTARGRVRLAELNAYWKVVGHAVLNLQEGAALNTGRKP